MPRWIMMATLSEGQHKGQYPYEETIKTQDFLGVLPWTAQDGEH